MQVSAYLSFDGQCEAAFQYYAEHLGGKIEMLMRFGEAPGCEELPPQTKGLIMHGAIQIGPSMVMATDGTPMQPHVPIQGATLALNVDNQAEAERVFAALSANGKVTMPLAQTFWAAQFGMCTDQFGVPWMINCEKA